MLLIQTYATIEDCNYNADTTKINNWNTVTSGNDSFKVSDYTVPSTDYSLTVKFNSIDAQIMIGNQQSWITGINMYGANKVFYYHNSGGTAQTVSLSSPVSSDVWKIIVEGTTISLYRNDVLVTTKTNCSLNYANNLRAYPVGNVSSIDYVKIKPL